MAPGLAEGGTEEEEEAMLRICEANLREERRDDADKDDKDDDVVEKRVRRGDMTSLSLSLIYIHEV